MNNKQAIAVFVAFALAYFFSALIRAITATLSPVLTVELDLQARDLGLLAGGYFLGFAVMQLPLGRWLDRIGPKKVNVWLLALAVVGCVIFSMAQSFVGLLAARVLIGVGVSACLMAALTGFRHWFSPEHQLRANSWMLMSGSMGMLASTLPVQWLMPILGWRALFVLLAVMFVIAMLVLAWQVPQHQATAKTKEDVSPEGRGDAHLSNAASIGAASSSGYGEVFRHPYFRRMAWIGLVNYGGMLSIQTLWSVPWMMKVGGYSAAEASAGLFAINLAMLCTFWAWGWVTPKLANSGWNVNRLITWGTPLNLLLLILLILASGPGGLPAGLLLIAYCVSSTAASLAQPAVGQAFSKEWVGRALSAYNLVIFIGVFALQWGIGLMVDALKSLGWTEVAAFQGALGAYAMLSVLAYIHFVWGYAWGLKAST